MARTLYLHLGPAKTGTSAVQYILSRHDSSIAFYPRVGLWPDGSHHNLVLNFLEDYQRPDLVRNDPQAMLVQIGEAARASSRDIVISSEILAGSKKIADFVAAVQAAIGEECRVVFVVVAREHRERAASLYNQRVKDAVLGETRDPDEFLVDHPERFCYTNMLRRLQKTGYEIKVLNYHPAEDYAARCFALFGITQELLPSVPRRNVSLGRLALITTLAANRATQSREERAEFDAVSKRIAGRFGQGEIYFSGGAVAEVISIFTADRKFLRNRFGVKLPKPKPVNQQNSFSVSESEFMSLAGVIQDLGEYGSRILKEVRKFVRASEQHHSHAVEVERDGS